MTHRNKKAPIFANPVLTVFLLSIAYWTYLFFSSSMVIRYDSLGYENLASLIYKSGWIQYFVTGPNREPMYPWVISISMRLADQLGVSYHEIQKFIQIIFLFITQLLTFKILKKLRAPDAVTALTLLYLGFSPALINSAFSLYSEILAYPFILGIILASAESWKLIQKNYSPKIFFFGLGLGLLFVSITFVKAVFQCILPVFLIPFFYLLLKALIKQNKRLFFNTGALFFMVILTFNAFVIPYKFLNKKYNGVYAFTDRGAWALYGNTARRMQPLDRKKVIAAFAFTAGEGVCRRFAEPMECAFWSSGTSDNLGFSKLQELTHNNIPKDKIDSTLIDLSKNLILQDPLQYLGVTLIMSFPLFFWESTKIGFVDYPAWLNKLYDWGMFKDRLRLFIFLMTFISFIYLIRFVGKNRSKVILEESFNPADSSLEDNHDIVTAFFILNLLLAYVVVHSFFYILTRYALPIAPLYLITIAFFFTRMISRIQK